jgi:AcrR family transcriptional regulator
MCPRPYRRGLRDAATSETKARILDAARALLTAEGGFPGFTIDAIARRADVARMTVYYQFGSKQGLLDALLDDIRVRGDGDRIAESMHAGDPLAVLAAFIEALARFWGTERLLIRRLRALTLLDADFEAVLRPRDELRRYSLRRLVAQISAGQGQPAADRVEEVADVLFGVISFEAFDAIAGTGPMADIVPRMQATALTILGLPAPTGP